MHRFELCSYVSEPGSNLSQEPTCWLLVAGVIKTELHRNNTGASIMYNLGNLFMKSIGQGASTQTMCAVCDDIVGGAYYADCAVKEPRNDANSETLAESLWERSDALIAGE